MSTPQKPLPSLDDTLHRIDDVLAEQPPDMPYGYVTPAERDLVFKHTSLDLSGITRTPGIVPPVFETSVVDRPPRVVVPPERTYVAYDGPYRGGWLARALHRLFG